MGRYHSFYFFSFFLKVIKLLFKKFLTCLWPRGHSKTRVINIVIFFLSNKKKKKTVRKNNKHVFTMYCTVYIVLYIGAINGNIFILRIPLLTKNFLLPSVDKFYPNKSRDIFFFFSRTLDVIMTSGIRNLSLHSSV